MMPPSIYNLQQNLKFAKDALDYIEDRYPIGSTNNEDASRRSELTQREVEKFLQKIRSKKSTDGYPRHDQVCLDASRAEAYGIGNCGEMSASVFKYLYKFRYYWPLSMVSVGKNHTFVVLGVNGREVIDNRDYFLSRQPNWSPDAVICDPWWKPLPAYSVRENWKSVIPKLLDKTEPGKYKNSDNCKVHLDVLCAGDDGPHGSKYLKIE